MIYYIYFEIETFPHLHMYINQLWKYGILVWGLFYLLDQQTFESVQKSNKVNQRNWQGPITTKKTLFVKIIIFQKTLW